VTGRTTRRLAVVVAAVVLGGLVTVEPVWAVAKQRVVRCKKPRACYVTAFAFTPDGSELFYVERFSGEIRRVVLATGEDTRWARVRDVAAGGERGVLGIAIDPHWPTEERVYVYYTEANPQRNRIVRLSKGAESGLERRVLATIPATGFHDGGVLHFGPDGKLYAVTGDAGVPGRSQRVTNPAGKVLRMEEDGSRPGDNPFARGRAFSIGHRNSFGFTFDPQTGRLWQTENGPECDDEVNLVVRGRNYGWGGDSDCPRISESGPKPVQPRLRLNPLIAPTGAAFCQDCGLGAGIEGDLLIGSYLKRRIYHLDLNANRDDIAGRGVLVRHGLPVLAVERAPDGSIWFSDLRGVIRLA
jgi:glucose/arabinose dehydrogenase